MTNNELKRLSRRELVDIIYQLKKNELELQDEIKALREENQDKRIRISTAGSIADAAVSVTNMFSSAQVTADLYLQEIARMREETEEKCAKKIKVTETKVKEIIADGQKKFDNLKAHYEKDYIKWQQLQSEIAALEQKRKLELCEDIENG